MLALIILRISTVAKDLSKHFIGMVSLTEPALWLDGGVDLEEAERLVLLALQHHFLALGDHVRRHILIALLILSHSLVLASPLRPTRRNATLLSGPLEHVDKGIESIGGPLLILEGSKGDGGRRHGHSCTLTHLKINYN